MTTGQLIEQIKKLAIAVDPDWARRRYEQAIAERKVVGYRNADGSANLSGYNLPVDRVAAASGRIDALAKAVKRAGDCRPIDHIRADLFLGMTDGTYTGLDDSTIIELLTTASAPNASHPGSDGGDDGEPDGNRPGTDGPGDRGPGDRGPDDRGPDDRGPTGEATAEGRDNEPAVDQPAGVSPADAVPEGDGAGGAARAEDTSEPVRPGMGLELRVRLSTLLGHDQYPAELAGWGPVHAELARELTSTLGGAQWRFAITGEHGHLTHCGVTRARPTGSLGRSATCRAIVELQVPATGLHAMATDPTTPAGWADVIADLTRQLNHDNPGANRDDAARRPPHSRCRAAPLSGDP